MCVCLCVREREEVSLCVCGMIYGALTHIAIEGNV